MIKLEQYRLLKEMTVYGLSKATGISRRHISKIEAGQSSPTSEKIIAICLVLDITPNELLGWEDIKNDKRRVTGSNGG